MLSNFISFYFTAKQQKSSLALTFRKSKKGVQYALVHVRIYNTG
jgi:hypothetical protein